MGSGLSLLEFWRISTYYCGDFRVTLEVPYAERERERRKLITLNAGVCVEHSSEAHNDCHLCHNRDMRLMQ